MGFRIASFLFFFSGLTSLLYQVIWQRMLCTVVGSSAIATAIILSVFLGGLSLGAFIFGRLSGRFRPLPAYGIIEGLIGIYALLTPYLFPVTSHIYALFGTFTSNSAILLNILRFILASVTLIVPTTLMGATLPILSHLIKDDENPLHGLSLLYGINTLGGAMGAITGGFILLPIVGQSASLSVGSIINCLIFAVVFLFKHNDKVNSHIQNGILHKVQNGNLGNPHFLPTSKIQQNGQGKFKLSNFHISFIFFSTGFASIALEVFWMRVLVLNFGSSTYAFSSMLSVILIGIGLGSIITAFINPRLNLKNLWFLILLILSLSFFLQIFTFNNMKEVMFFFSPHGRMNHLNLTFDFFLSGIISLLPPTLLLGISFPLGLSLFKRENIGSGVGFLYGLNTIGAVIGAILATFVIIPSIGTQNGILLCGILFLVLSITIIEFKVVKTTSILIFASLIYAAFFLIVFKENGILLSPGVFSEGKNKVISLREDCLATITVEERLDNPPWLSLSVNGVNVAGTKDDLFVIQKLQGHLPLLFCPQAESVLHIGFGSGGTAHSVSLHHVKRIVIAEISSGVLKTSVKYFRKLNGGILGDPRVEIHIEDGRNYLLRSSEKFDCILSDSVHPRFAGNGSLYTIDYFYLCRKHLSKDGIISMWLPFYSLSDSNLRSIIKSFSEVFPNTTVWFINSTFNSYTIVMAKNGKEPFSVNDLKRGLENEKVSKDLKGIDEADLEHILDNFLFGGNRVKEYCRDVPFHTDDNLIVEYQSARVWNRVLSEYINLYGLVRFREPPDVYFDFSKEPELKKRLDLFYKATSWNLIGQLYYLKGDKVKADEAFGMVKKLNSYDLEPMEAFGRHVGF